MELEDKIELCTKWLSEDFKISENAAHRLIYDLDLEDIVTERYAEELEDAERDFEEDNRYNKEHYNDGWNDHQGV